MLTDREKNNRKTLQERKPLAFLKIAKFPDKIASKESIALVQLQYNYACNFKCVHCAIEKFKQPDKTLTVSDVKNIADQADAMGLASICISGGEPLIFPDLKEVIGAIGQERFCLSMDTNGWFLDEDKVVWLVEQGVDRIHLSLDGLAENHDGFRLQNGSWKRCVEALPFCKKHGLGVIINIVATRSVTRSGEIEKQLQYTSQFGFHTSIIHAKPVGSFEGFDDKICDSKDIAYIQELTKKYNAATHLTPNCGNDFGCLCFKRHFSITAYGDVLPCPWIPITMGNIHEELLEDIVKRSLSIKWFSYDHKFSCQSGNCDNYFYKNILPQYKKSKQYPADWREIQW